MHNAAYFEEGSCILLQWHVIAGRGLLQAMLCSSDSEYRKFAIETICKIRGKSKFGDTSHRIRRNPTLNVNATSLDKLINWSKDVHKPILTCSMSKEDLLKLEDNAMEVINFPFHGQSIDRCVKEVFLLISDNKQLTSRHSFFSGCSLTKSQS